jgi:hypothetical protein
MIARRFAVVSALLLVALAVPGMAPELLGGFDPGLAYTVDLSMVNSSGSLVPVASTTVVAGSDGRLGFSFSGVPTLDEGNFLVVRVSREGRTLRQGLAATAPLGIAGSCGLNSLSDAQAGALLGSFARRGPNPCVAAFLFAIFRTADFTDAEANAITLICEDAIVGPGGFEDSLGLTPTQLQTFRRALVYNANGEHLGKCFERFKSSVDAQDAATASAELARIGVTLAELFAAAAAAAGTTPSVVQGALDAAGGRAESNPNFVDLSPAREASIGQAMSAFYQTLGALAVKQAYRDAFSALGASTGMVLRFDAAVERMSATLLQIQATYGSYMESGTPMPDAVMAAMNAAYSQAFDTFESDIAATLSEIAALQLKLSTVFGVSIPSLPPMTYTDYGGTTHYWPIPKVVLYSFVADLFAGGGSFAYTRQTTPVPANMTWLGGVRTDFSGMPSGLAALEGMAQDIEIAGFRRYGIYGGGTPPTHDQEKAAREALEGELAAILASMTGSRSGSLPLTAAEKGALLRLAQRPDPN